MSDPNPRTQRYLEILDSVLDITHDVLKDLHHQSTTPPEPGAPKPDHTIAIERIARTIRRTILLAQRIAEPPKPERVDPKPDRTASRKRIIREVEDHIHRTVDTDEEAEALHADLLDRLDSPELEDEIGTRPVPEIITDMIRDLGLDSEWGPNRFKLRNQQDVAALADRAAQLLPSEPRPPRTPAWQPKRRPQQPLPDDPAAAVAMVLRLGAVRAAERFNRRS